MIIQSLFVFVVVGYCMMRIGKDATKKEKIFSWTLYLIYCIVFIGTLISTLFNNKTITLIGFFSIAGMLLFMLLGKLISDQVIRHKYAKIPKHNEKGVIISAVMDSSKEVRATGAEPKFSTRYKLRMKYTDEEGNEHICKTLHTYTLAEIAYLRNFKYLPILVADDICDLVDTNVSIAPKEYSAESVEDLDISNGDAKFEIVDESITDIAKWTNEKWAVYITSLPLSATMVVLGLIGLINKGVSTTAIFLLAAGMVILIPTIWVICKCQKMIRSLNKGSCSIALDFKPTGMTDSLGTIYDVQFTYNDNSGKVRTATERVLPADYEKIKLVKKLPIKVYKKTAKIDCDRLNNYL